jgi:DNA repair protein RadC
MNNAASVIVHHNHAEGCCWPSLSDWNEASLVQKALGLFDVPMLDHVITSDYGQFSFAERGLS